MANKLSLYIFCKSDEELLRERRGTLRGMSGCVGSTSDAASGKSWPSFKGQDDTSLIIACLYYSTRGNIVIRRMIREIG